MLSLQVRAKAELELRERARMQNTGAALSFSAWLNEASPGWPWHYAHLQFIRTYLDKVTSGEIKRLMIFLPPRHYKSEMVTVRYSAWRIEREPSMRVVIGSYNQILADKFSRKTRRIVEGRVALSTRTAVHDWETQEGGGLRAVGVGGGITGQGADLLIIDDPVKSREEANSEAYRNKMYDWFTDDLYTRLEANSAIILIMTRWHGDDLAGRILESETAGDWTVISLPAEAEEGDPMGRDVGEALCPEKFDLEELANRRAVLRNSYYALYQQRPQPPEGSFFKREWFEIVDAAPAIASRVRYWDNAGTDGDGDYTAGVLMARTGEGQYFVEDVVRGQWSAMERENVKRQTAALDAERYGNKVHIWTEQEPGSGGKDSAQATIRGLEGYTARAERVSGEKTVRAEPYAAQCEAGNVKLVRGRWNAPYLNELCAFPMGMNDDQVDASSGAFNKLAIPQKPRNYGKVYR